MQDLRIRPWHWSPTSDQDYDIHLVKTTFVQRISINYEFQIREYIKSDGFEKFGDKVWNYNEINIKKIKKKEIVSSKSLLSSYSYASDVTHGPFKSQS